MNTTITLDEGHFQIALAKARTLGTTPDLYLAALIDADARSFDQMLGPVRTAFESVSEDDLDGLMDRAVKVARRTNLT